MLLPVGFLLDFSGFLIFICLRLTCEEAQIGLGTVLVPVGFPPFGSRGYFVAASESCEALILPHLTLELFSSYSILDFSTLLSWILTAY